MGQTAEIFLDHGRPAVRLPEEVHVSGEPLIVRQDATTGDIVLAVQRADTSAEREQRWNEFFTLRDSLTAEERDQFVVAREFSVPEPRDLR